MNEIEKIILSCIENKLSHEQIGKILNISAGAVRKRVSRNEVLSKAKKFSQSIGKYCSIRLRTCRHCFVDIEERTRSNKGLCKKCINKEKLKYSSKYQKEMIKKSQENPSYSIYYLPEEHYIGVATIPKRRVAQHSSKGKITEGWEIVATYKNAKLCALHEALMHYIGYNGSQYDNMLKSVRKKNE